jgi:hypothetical protein
MVGKEQIIYVRNMELICELVVAIFLGTRNRGGSCPGRRGGPGSSTAGYKDVKSKPHFWVESIIEIVD